MIDEKLLVDFHSLIKQCQRTHRREKLMAAHSFPRDVELSSSQHTSSRMTTEMMHPSFLLELSHQRILREIKFTSQRLSSLGRRELREGPLTIQGNPVRPSFQACNRSQASGSSSFQIFSCSSFGSFAPSSPYLV